MPATDPTFYRSPGAAVAAAPEQLAYVVAFDPAGQAKDALAVVDCDPKSSTYGGVVGWAELPTAGNELHHFGWSACSSALCHQGHGHHDQERRYLLVPGIRSSNTYVLDTKPDPRQPVIKHTIEASELAAKAGYSRPHTVHCGPGGIFMSALGGPNGDDGPGGVALIDHDTFEVIGPWEVDRGPQLFAYDVWWHLKYDTVMTSEWGSTVDDREWAGPRGPARTQVWTPCELLEHVRTEADPACRPWRPAPDGSRAAPGPRPVQSVGIRGIVISAEDLSASVWLWHKNGDQWSVDKVITIPAEPADADDLPPALKPFGAAPPLVTDIDLSVDDHWLYVSCFGTGELKQYDVSDPFHPRETASVRLGGIVRREPHPAAPDLPLTGGAQMVEISRDGRRVYVTNSLYALWDEVFYPDGVGAWMAKLDADISAGGLAADTGFFPHGDDFRGLRVHQTRLQGGDASSDSYCFTS